MVSFEEASQQSTEYFEGNTLAANVFVSKYALKNEKGELLEPTPEQMHRRLAKEFARIERKYENPLSEEKIFSYLDKFKYVIPQGSPMAGIGNKYQLMSLSNCVHGESLVYTKEQGLVKMRDIVPGMHVLTHRNRFRKVLRHWSNGEKETYTIIRSFSGKQVAVTTEREMGRFCAVTADHRIYTSSGEWETVENLLGKHNKSLAAPFIAVPDVIEEAQLSAIPLGLGRTVILDETLAWIFGLYFAEGAIKNQASLSPSVYFTLAKDEMRIAERISAWAEENLGHKAWIQTWDGMNFIQVNVFDKFFGRFMLDNFGSGFNKKRIPEWVFALPEKIRTSFLDGFMTGDATNYESLEDDYNVFSIANPTLAYELGLLARSAGKKVRFNFQATGKLIKHRTVTVSMSSANEIVKFVKSPVLAEVFDMEVEEDHSFVAGDIICHNCFVIPPPHDSMSGITYTIGEEKEIMKRRGGVGFDISPIRPKGMHTSNAAGTTDGIAVFMDDFSDACRRTAQNGRRGALMLTISVHHPEIQTFIDIKKDKSRVTGANISIRLSDEFMEAVRDGKEVELRFPVDSPEPKIRKMVDAQALWTEIVTAAHASAEPGLLFWDPIMKYCPANNYPGYKTSSTNPCGEITLSPYDSCRLLLINTLSFVKNPYTCNAFVDWVHFGQVVRDSQRLMDDIIDLELESIDRILAKIDRDPEPEHIKVAEKRLWTNIREACERGRRTGLGVTAVGDFVAALGFRYGSDASIVVVEELYKQLALNSYASSIQLAKERGAFPAFSFELEKNDPFLQRIWDAAPFLYEEYLKYGRRNIANTTTAPAGSTSILAKAVTGFGTTSGIENAVFAAFYLRRKKINPSDTNARVDFVDAQGDKWTEFKVYNQGFAAWKEINQKNDENVEQSPYWKSTIADVDWVAKVEMQGAAQKWIDHSISNTTNLPRDASVETVKAVYMKGWEAGCKGITIYRDGCRDGVILSAEGGSDVEEEMFVEHHAPKRPAELECDVYHPTIQGEKWTIFIGKLSGRPYEVMGGLSKHITLPKRVREGKIAKRNGEVNPAEYDFHYDFESPENETIIKDIGNIFENATHAAFTRTISLALRHGAPVQYVVEQLLKGAEKESDLFSFSKVMSRVLKNYIKDGTKASQKKCPDCGSTNLSYQQGCVTCLDCGSSKCS